MASTWGSASTTKDWTLLIEGTTPISPPEILDNHGMSDLTGDEIDRVLHKFTKRVNGRSRTLTNVLRPAERTGITFTMMFNGFKWSRPLELARQNANCPTTLFLRLNCPPNTKEEYARVLTNVIFNKPTDVSAQVDVGEEANPVTEQSEAYGSEELLIWKLGNNLVTTLAEPAYGIVSREKDCIDCDDKVGQEFAVLATNGGAFNTYVTSNRFSSVVDRTAVGAVAPLESLPRNAYYKDDVLLVAFTNAAGVTGGTVMSGDNGVSATIDSNITAAIFDVGYFDGQYVAAGGALAGQAFVYLSNNGIAWTSTTGAALPANKAILSLAVDTANENIYFVGEDGLAVKAYRSATNALSFTALTLPGSVGTTDIKDVAVLGSDHIAVGGVGGYYAESLDGGLTWTQPSVTTTSAINAIAGDQYRTLYGAGTTIATRDILVNMTYKNVVLDDGQTIVGNVTGIAYNGDPNYFASVTSTGEVVMSKPYFPRA